LESSWIRRENKEQKSLLFIFPGLRKVRLAGILSAEEPRSEPTAWLASGFEARSDVFV